MSLQQKFGCSVLVELRAKRRILEKLLKKLGDERKCNN
jgi:hypothetical protein